MLPITITLYSLAALLTLTAAVALALLWMVHTERRKSELARQQLLQQQSYTKALLDTLPFPVAVKNSDGIYLILNAACERDCDIHAEAIGQTSLDLPGQGLFATDGEMPANQLFHEASLDVVHTVHEQKREITYTGSDGAPRVGIWWDCPIHISDRGVVGSLGVLFDITGFREMEKEARSTELGLREISQGIPVVMFTAQRGQDRLRRLTFLTGNLRALFGLDLQDLLEPGMDNVIRDQPLRARIHPEDQVSVGQMMHRAKRHLQTYSIDFRAYGEKGLRWIHMTMAPRPLPGGGMRWTGYFIDTTHINMHNEALRVARDAAERASKAKADFLATMSHEIRTPMNGVIGMLELLGHTHLDSEQHELLHAVEDSASVLLQILNDVLDFSKLEAGNLHIDDAPFDLRLLIDNVVSLMAGHMHKKGLHIQVAIDAALAGMLQGDSVRIRQILLNLLNNASKFTEHGSVAIGLRVLGDDGTAQRLHIDVTDTGIGIATDKQAHLFTPFSQAESWTTRRYGGTGLGLAICRHLVQLMGGAIQLTSQPGVGTTITIELELPIEQREVKRPPGLSGRHAVVRLRSSETAAALADYLLALGLTIEQIPPSQPMRRGLSANLLFVDVGDNTSPESIAAQTIIVDHESVSRDGPYAEGDNIHLSANPLKWQAVSRACMMGLKALNPQARPTAKTAPIAVAPIPSPPPSAAPSSAPNGRQHDERGRILIAEDHPVNQVLVRRQLELLGWSCDVVGDGREAYAALCHGNYAMLMTDCQMPLMDGYELATAWRQREATEGALTRLPIVAMTASALDGEIVRCRNAGMDDFLSKPVQLRQLDEKIEAWMPQQPAVIPPPDPVNSGAENGASGEAGTFAPDANMLQVLIETSQTDLHKLDLAIVTGNTAAAAQHLHRILGALQLFTDAPTIADGRQWLENLHTEHAVETLQQLPTYAESLRQILGELEHPINVPPAH